MTKALPRLERTCLGCEADVSDRHRLAKFCNRMCQRTYVRKQCGKEVDFLSPRKCVMCPTVISNPTHYNQLYCSDECRKRNKANYTKHWAENNPEKVKALWQKKNTLEGIEHRMVVHYGGYHGQYKDMYDAQGGQCAICHNHAPLFGQGRLCVDHAHSCCPGDRSCGKCIRGLLCHDCNKALGGFKDNKERLANAHNYLERLED